MIHFTTKQLLATITIVFAFNNIGIAQDDCKVLLEAIAGQYQGDCKKSLADGEGTAKGEDSYVGEFKKGVPDGLGKYTWANGNVYEGEFKKGLKEGKGKMSMVLPDGQASVQTGYWKKDKYIGEHESPYKLHSRSSGVLSVRLNEFENPEREETALFIEIQHRGKSVPGAEFGLNEITGNYLSKFPVGRDTKVIVSSFPFRFTIGYQGETVDIEVYQATSWKIIIDCNK